MGVALVGWPSRLQTSDEVEMLRVLRVAVQEGHKNGCSMLYGACWRAARAMGCTSMDTFTHLDEPGTSLRGAGWIDGGLTKGGEYDRASRPRKAQVDAAPKRRWWAPGSLRAPQLLPHASGSRPPRGLRAGPDNARTGLLRPADSDTESGSESRAGAEEAE